MFASHNDKAVQNFNCINFEGKRVLIVPGYKLSLARFIISARPTEFRKRVGEGPFSFS